jgi:SAM-dependent methyltransferase
MTSLADVGRCPACDSPSRSFLFHSHDWIHEVPGSFDLMRCDRCASVYPDPRPSPESLADYYPEDEYYAYRPAARHRLWERQGRLARVWYAARRGALFRRGYVHLGGSRLLGTAIARLPVVGDAATLSLGILLHPWVPDGSLLDVGCGNGRYLDLMRALGWRRVVGVDTSARSMSQVQGELGIEAYCGDIRELGLADQSFDAVSMSHTLEHVDEPAAVLAEVRRVLKPNGRVAIAVPNARSLAARLLGEHWIGWETPRHLVNFSPAGLQSAVERSGLRLEELRTSAQGSYAAFRFSMSRRRGDPREIYTDATRRFGFRHRAQAAALALVEHATRGVRVPVGELICAVARR